MTDVLIRNVPDDDLRAIDSHASRLGISRNEYLRRRIADDARRTTQGDKPVRRDDFAKFSDLADDDLMSSAWS
jgi:hypothetical protein